MRTLLISMLLLSVAAALAADSAVVGTWKVTSTGPGPSDEFQWTMTIKEADGKLTGTMVGDMGEFTLKDVKFADGKLSAQLEMDANTYSFEAKVDGDKMDGTWKGVSTGESGTIKGKKA